MSHHIREMIEQRERDWLSPLAAKAADSSGRPVTETQDPIRTAFQRDRDRILHSKSFRRLKHKTQVFLDPKGDHFRTRLTHSLEVAQIARTIGRALRLNEDLIEAIALGHDVGHTPFGHAGESALDEAIKELAGSAGILPAGIVVTTLPGEIPRGFKHYEQSLRIVDHLEKLNLTEETRAGIGGHSKGRADLSAFDGEPTSTLEAAVVRVSDRIAYLNHDLDDALRSGIIREVPQEFQRIGPTHAKRIGAMVEDVILNSLDKPTIILSPSMLQSLNAIKEWLFDNVYLRYPGVFPTIPKAQALVKELFRYFCQRGNLPEEYDGIQGAVDYVAGMTDRFAIATFIEIRLPEPWPIP